MLCKSVSQAFFHSLLLFMACAVPLLAPPPESYAYDTLSSDAIDAIKKTHALEAQLKQDSLATPANAAANKEKIAALTQARAELSRVYSTPLFTRTDDTSGASNEFDWIQNSRKTLASSISESDANFDPAPLRAATSASVTTKKEAEKSRLAWLKSKNAELETLQTDIDKAEKTFRETGNATDFLKAQALHQQMLQEFGPLKSVNGLDGSAELAQADLVRATHARAVKIIQDTIDAKLEAGSTDDADMGKWNTSLAVAKRALAQQEQNVADLKAQAQATKKNVDDFVKTATKETQDAFNASGGNAAVRTTDANMSSIEDAADADAVIARHRKLLEDNKAYYRTAAGLRITDDTEKALRDAQTLGVELNDQQRALRAALELQQEKPRAGESDAKIAELKTRLGQLDIQTQEQTTRMTALRNALQVQSDAEDFDAKVKAVEALPDDSPAHTAAKEELRRDLVARDLFEAEMQNPEYKRLIVPVENDARRAAAEQLFSEVDGSASDPSSPSLRDAFKKLLPQQQIELTKYLQDAKSELADEHPFKRFLDAAHGAAASTSAGASSADTADTDFTQLYRAEWANRKQAAWDSGSSPLARAKWYKDNGQLFAQIRQQVDTATKRAPEEEAEMQKTAAAQLAKALAKNPDAEKIRAADMEELKIYRETGEDKKLTLEQARQRRILTKAPWYYAAIAETLTQLRSGLSPEAATKLLDAFNADPAAFLTQHRPLGKTSTDTSPIDGSAQLAAFRQALARQGIKFWRDEDVAPEITNALNLLKNPSKADTSVKALVDSLPPSLGEEVAGGKILEALRKIGKAAPGYQSKVTTDETPGWIKSAAQLAEQATAIKAARNMSSEDAAVAAEKRSREYLAKADDAIAASGSAEGVKPVARLFIVFDAEGSPVENPHKPGTVFMTKEEVAATGTPKTDSIAVNLDLTDMDEHTLRQRLTEALRGQIAEVDALVDHILPTGDQAALQAEMQQLDKKRKVLIPLEQARMKAAAELQAAKGDFEFSDVTKKVTLDDTDVADGESEDVTIRKMIRHFDLVKDEYERVSKVATDNPGDAEKEADATAQRRETHAYLLSLIDQTKESLEREANPLSTQTRTLLLALQDEGLRMLEAPEMDTLNKEAQIDPYAEREDLVSTHRTAMQEEADAEQEQLEAEKTNPSAALKRARIEEARVAYEAELERIRKSLVPEYGTTEVTEDQKARARAARQKAQQTFDELSFDLRTQIQHDLETEPEDRIRDLEDETAALRRTIKSLSDGSQERTEAEAQLKKLQALRVEEGRAITSHAATQKLEADETAASTARSTRLATSLRSAGISGDDAQSVAHTMVSARSKIPGKDRRPSRASMTRTPRLTGRAG